MKNSEMMKQWMIAGVSALLLTALGVTSDASATEPPRPNIVVLLSDDMHWQNPGFNGGPVATPHLDRLAREGTQLTQFYVHAVCSPTRAALLTGRYPFRTGMEERSHGNDVAGMLTDERTMAESLHDAGYYTALIGKWHLGNWHKHHLPMQRGFDHQYGIYGALVGYYTKCRERFYDWHRNEQALREEGYTTDLIAQEASKVIESLDTQKPFFLYIPFTATHGPDEAPEGLVDKYLKLDATQLDGLSPANLAFYARKYAMLDLMDQAVGQILASLESRGVLDNTLIVFFNDNGGRKENPPYRGGKGQTFEGGVRVPCILRWPDRIPAGRRVAGMIHVVDLYPTLLGQAGASLDQPLAIDGMDMWNTITLDQKSLRREVVHSLPGERVDTGPMSIQQGAYKLVDRALFNIEQDPFETNDLADRHPDIYQSLHQRLVQLVKERRIPETHTNISSTISQPLLIFGKEENADPPAWLAPYVKSLPPTKKELQRAKSARSK